MSTDGANSFYSTQLVYNEKTDLVFPSMLPAPDRGSVCVQFKYRKYSLAGHKSSLSGILSLSIIGILSSCLVLVWPFKETPGKISVFKDSPEVTSWIQAEITFRNVDNVFLLMFRTGGPTTRQDALYLAVDDVVVTSGRCNNV